MVEYEDNQMDLQELLPEHARRLYNDMADHVDLSAPAVRNRVTRLQETGGIQRFMADIDR